MIDRNHRNYLCDGDKGLRTNTHSVARTSKQYARNVCSPIVYSVEMKICRKKQSSYIFVIITDWKAYVLNALLLIAITHCMLPNQVFKKGGFLKADERLVLGFQRFSVETYVQVYTNLSYVKILLYAYLWHNLKIYLTVLRVMDNFKNLCNILVWISSYEDHLKKISKILTSINIIL